MMMDILDKLIAALGYMDKSPDFNESTSVLHIVEAIETIKDLRQQLAEQAIIKANLCESLQEVTHLANNYIRWKGGMSDGSDDRAIEQAQSLIKAHSNKGE